MSFITEVKDFLEQYELWGNNGLDYLIFIVLLLFLSFALKPLFKLILRHLNTLTSKSINRLDDLLISELYRIHNVIFFPIALFISSRCLLLTDTISKSVSVIFSVSILFLIITLFKVLIDFTFDQRLRKVKRQDGIYRPSVRAVIQSVVYFFLWVIGGMVVLSNIGINITALITGMGIVGIAIAFAIQKVLGDVIAGVTLLIENSLKVGDFLEVGSSKGKVEKIGLRSTQLRAPTGELVVVPNKNIINIDYRNHQSRTNRFKFFKFGVDLGTDVEVLEKIPGYIKLVLEKIPEVVFDRCHFQTIEDACYRFQVVFHLNTSDFASYVKAEQAVNLSILKVLAEHQVIIAQPSQKITLFN